MMQERRKAMQDNWQETTPYEARSFSQGQFQGMTMQALQDLRRDIQELKQEQKIKGYIHYAIAGLSGLVGMVLGAHTK